MESLSFQLARDSNPISLSPAFVLPEEKRPNLSQVSTLSTIPIIDLSRDHDQNHGNNSDLVHEISKACEEYGFFQIINHGVPQDLCQRTMKVITDFFKLPSQERAKFFSTDVTKQVKVINYDLKTEDQENATLMWSEAFDHPWDPNGDFSALLPENPPEYKQVFVELAKELDKLIKKLLGLMSLGLGLERDCLESKLGQNPGRRAQANFYPQCPNPDLTLGLAVHTDISALTVVMQSEEASGLQVIKDDKWISVDPIPNSFVINIGDQLQVLSNSRYKSVHHRCVTNKLWPRISLAIFYGPNKDTWIGPVEELLDQDHPPVYRSYQYSEFLEEFTRQAGTRRMVKEVFEIQRKN